MPLMSAFSAATVYSVTLFAPNRIISLSFLKKGLARLYLFSVSQSDVCNRISKWAGTIFARC